MESPGTSAASRCSIGSSGKIVKTRAWAWCSPPQIESNPRAWISPRLLQRLGKTAAPDHRRPDAGALR